MNEIQKLESSIIGALLQFRDTHHRVIPLLEADTFTIDGNRLTFEAIKALYDDNSPIDLVTVADRLNKTNDLERVGGAYQLTEYTRIVGSGVNAEYHSYLLKEKQLRRELEQIGWKYQHSASDDTIDIFEQIDSAQSDVLKLGSITAAHKISSMKTLAQEVEEQGVHAKHHKDELLGVASGFTELDRITNGWKQPDLIIVAGRPAMGKTSFAVQCAINATELTDCAIGIFSLEMSKHQIARKIMSNKAEISSNDIEAGRFDSLTSIREYCEQMQIYINDTPALSILEFKTSARKMVKEYGCRMIVVDYLQLMTVDYRRGASRENEVSRISATLKATAKELEIPVIALSQLSRGVEGRSAKIPTLADLRESGAIEQDADLVLFLYRPEYYGVEEDELGEDTKGMAKVIIAKHRNGSIGIVNLHFNDEITKFTNHETELAF